MDKERNRFIELLKSPIGLLGIAVLIVMIVLVVFSVIKMTTGQQQPDSQTTYEYDPASQTEIAWMPITNGDDVELPIYIGFTDAIKSGMTTAQMDVMKDAIEQFALSKGIILERVSYLHDSLTQDELYVFDLKVVLNVDEATLKVRVDSSKGWRNIIGLVVTLWDDEGKEVYKEEVTGEEVCKYFNACDSADHED